MFGIFLKVGGAVGGNVAWGVDVDGDGGGREVFARDDLCSFCKGGVSASSGIEKISGASCVSSASSGRVPQERGGICAISECLCVSMFATEMDECVV